MTVGEAIAQAKKLRPVNANIDDALLLRYINKIEGIVQTELLKLSTDALTKYGEADTDTELLVPAPYDDIYPANLMMMIDLSLGEAGKYNNDKTYFNEAWSDYVKWFSRTHIPGTVEMRGFFITAYGIAVKHGYTGTEEEWLASLKGERGFGVSLRYFEEDSALQWCSLGDGIWQNLLTLADIQGEVVSQTLVDAQAAKSGAEAAQEAVENMTASTKALAEGAAPTVEKTISDGIVNLDFGVPKGDTGEKGDQGDKGDKGDKGDTGAQGIQGETGETGAQGVQGVQGYSVAAVYKKSGTGAAGTTDVYGVKINDAGQSEVGAFSVYNGADGQGAGDMLKSQYDTNNDGVVDDASKLGGQLPEHYATKTQLGTAAAKDVPASGNASSIQVVMGNDTRLADARSASDVYAWAKAATKPSYTAADVGAAAEVHSHSGYAQSKFFANVTVAVAAWVADATYANWPYRAAVALTGVTADMMPDVMLAPDDAAGGVLAPVAVCYAGGVYLYANAVPEADIIIPTVECRKVVS